MGRILVTEEYRIVRHVGQQLFELHRRQYLRNVQPLGLLSGLLGDQAQAFHIGVVGIRPTSDQQLDLGRAQFRYLLDDGLQPRTLDQRDQQHRSLPCRLRPCLLDQGYAHRLLADLYECRLPFAVTAIEDGDLVPHALAHDGSQITPLLGWQG
nr:MULTISPECIES: hypothetical protein [Asticcacaulis]